VPNFYLTSKAKAKQKFFLPLGEKYISFQLVPFASQTSFTAIIHQKLLKNSSFPARDLPKSRTL
jgi:hypothetical protein